MTFEQAVSTVLVPGFNLGPTGAGPTYTGAIVTALICPGRALIAFRRPDPPPTPAEPIPPAANRSDGSLGSRVPNCCGART